MDRAATGRLWIAVLAALVVCVALVTWFPLLSIGRVTSINYNEGWNAYRQSMAAEGRPLYAAAPALWTTNYPFLSFHFVGALGSAIGDMVLAGRIVSAVSTAVVAVLTVGIVRALTGSTRAGLHAGLCLLLWIATFTPDRRAMDDPELLGLAFAAFGLFAYVLGSGRSGWLALSALAFAVGMFVKQDLFALPLSVGMHLLIKRRWSSLALWACTGLVAAAVLLWLTDIVDGPFFVADLLRPRRYMVENLVGNVLAYLLHFSAPLAVGAVLLRRWGHADQPVLIILLVLTQFVSVLLSGGRGVAENIFLPAMLALAVVSGVALGATPARRPRALVAAMLVPALAGAAFVPSQLAKDLSARRDLPAFTADAHRTIKILRAADGPTMCEDILMCYRADKALDYDPFFVDDQLSIGRLAERDMLALLVSHHYAAIEIDGQVNLTPPIARRRRFTASFMQTLSSTYRLIPGGGAYCVFEPR